MRGCGEARLAVMEMATRSGRGLVRSVSGKGKNVISLAFLKSEVKDVFTGNANLSSQNLSRNLNEHLETLASG